MSNIAISQEQRQIILALLEKYVPQTKVWVYGSRVTGKSGLESDLDMIVFANKNQSMQINELKEAFEESHLPFRVDIFAWNDLGDNFKKNIEAQHIELIGTCKTR